MRVEGDIGQKCTAMYTEQRGHAINGVSWNPVLLRDGGVGIFLIVPTLSTHTDPRSE